ncbi:uncharacterized protein LOC103393827 [Cynoglossus semilaevis]|uniref:uncharacterized protein LOC103393827 n=1 Tax=Cynoglossus semilaevis TaxID=244447 RepID=UPI0004955AD1|nr:uncharacterized protein LOC103393827 [Cynoglossus semilaevis]
MNLWLRAHFLLAGLILCSSAPTQDECETLLQPVSLKNIAKFYGRFNIITVFAEGVYDKIMSSMESSWINNTAGTLDGVEALAMSEVNKINGKCFSAKSTMKLVEDKVLAEYANITTSFHVLPGSEDVMVFSCNSTFSGDIDGLLQFLNLDVLGSPPEGVIRSLYLMSHHTTVKDSDLKQFKQQASCLGFQGEPVFQYDPKNGFCSEDETIKVEF